MFYIRFFKQPRILPKSQQEGTISALVTITSDLGESFLLQDSSIVARAWSIDGTTIIARGKFLWTRGSRSLKIDIDVDVRTFGARPVVLQVSGSDSMGPDKLLEKTQRHHIVCVECSVLYREQQDDTRRLRGAEARHWR